MGRYIDQFDFFDPIKGRVSGLPTSQAPDIALRARQLLRGRTAQEVEDLALLADSFIEQYFEAIKNDEIKRLESIEDSKFCEQILEDGKIVQHRFLYEMEDELEILTRDNISDIESLKEAITRFDIISSSEVDNIQEFEYFAAMGLWHIADAIRYQQFKYDFQIRKKVKRNSEEITRSELSIIADNLLKAMEAVCYGEHLRQVNRLIDFYKKRADSLKAQIFNQENLDNIRKEIQIEMEKEAAHQRSENGRKLNKLSQKKRHKAHAAVVSDWEKNRTSFSSAEKASHYYFEWLSGNGHQQFEPRTIANWIRDHAKKNGILLR